MANDFSPYDGFDWSKWYETQFNSWARNLVTPKIQETLQEIARQAGSHATTSFQNSPEMANAAMQFSSTAFMDSVRFPEVATIAKTFATSDAIAEVFRTPKFGDRLWSRELASSFVSFAKLQTSRGSSLLSPDAWQGLTDLAEAAEETLATSSYEPIVKVAESVQAGEYESSTIEAIEEYLDSAEGSLPPIDDATRAMLALRPDLERATVRVAVFIVFSGSWTALVMFLAVFVPDIFTGIGAVVGVPSGVAVGSKASQKVVDSWVPYQTLADDDGPDDTSNAP